MYSKCIKQSIAYDTSSIMSVANVIVATNLPDHFVVFLLLCGSCVVAVFVMVLTGTKHDDIIKWKHFPRYWPFVREIDRWPWISQTKASDAKLWCIFDLRLNKRLSKQSRRRWFDTPSYSLWRHCNGRKQNTIDRYCISVLASQITGISTGIRNQESGIFIRNNCLLQEHT